MPPKAKSSKTSKPLAKKPAAKSKPVAKKAPARSKSVAKPAARKPSAKPAARKKKPATLLQSVKDSVQTGFGKVGAAVKSITPGALLPKSAKSKRR